MAGKAWGSPKAAPECNSEQLDASYTITIFYASVNVTGFW